jgi:hypothetical protein
MDFIILDNMTRNNPGTMILVLGDDNEGKVKLREHRIEEFINTLIVLKIWLTRFQCK